MERGKPRKRNIEKLKMEEIKMKKWYTVYYVEKGIWGAWYPEKHFFLKKENAEKFAEQDYTSNVQHMKVTSDELDRMRFDD